MSGAVAESANMRGVGLPRAATITPGERRRASSWLAAGRVLPDGLGGRRFDPLARLAAGAPWLVTCGLGIALAAGIGYLDAVLGDVSLSPAYLIPVLAATAASGRLAGIVTAVAAAAAWTIGDAVELGNSLAASFINGAAFLVLFVVGSLLLAALNDALGRARDLARTDTLTGCANRRSLEERFEIERYRVARTSEPLSAVYVDIDGFKRINDRLGHAAGDAAIRNLGHALASVTRHGDLVARLGGDEFLLLLPGIDPAQARLVAHRLLDFPLSDTSGSPMTLSLGAVTCGGAAPVLEEVLDAADAAMYEAKRLGGNGAAFRVLVDDTTPAGPPVVTLDDDRRLPSGQPFGRVRSKAARTSGGIGTDSAPPGRTDT